MASGDRVSGSVFLIAGLFAAYHGWQLGVGEPAAPGPGFLPFWSGVVLAGLAAIVAGASFLAAAAPGRGGAPVRQHHLAFVCLAALFLYVAILGVLGFLLSTFLLLVVLFRLGRSMSWPVRLAAALVTTAGFYVLFARLLLVQFPAGVLGF